MTSRLTHNFLWPSSLEVEPVVGIEPTTDGLQNRCSTAELNWLPKMVGAARFELATSCTPSKRASQATLRPVLASLLSNERRTISRRRCANSTLFGEPPHPGHVERGKPSPPRGRGNKNGSPRAGALRLLLAEAIKSFFRANINAAITNHGRRIDSLPKIVL